MRYRGGMDALLIAGVAMFYGGLALATWATVAFDESTHRFGRIESVWWALAWPGFWLVRGAVMLTVRCRRS